MNNEIAISVKNLSKKFKMYGYPAERIKELLHPFRKKYHREFWALRDISLEVSKGSTFGIIGQNGCGKSTLLQLICGILQPTTGSVKVNGRISALLELGAGFNRDFTGRENVFMNGAVMGISRDEMEERFERIADFADIGHFIDQPVKTYSSGMYVRLAFAVAINVDPDILIVDEALAVGDVAFQAKCYARIQDLKEQHRTILFVSHAMETIRKYCDEVALIEKGMLERIGDPNTIIDTFMGLLAAREEQRRRTGPGSYKDVSRLDKREFGADDAEITEVRILDGRRQDADGIVTGETYTIRVIVLFKRDISDPVVGFFIRDLKGIDVAGASTSWSSSIGKVETRERVVIEYTQRLPLNPGHYTLALGVSEFVENPSSPAERQTDVMAFKVTGKTRYSGLIDIESKIRVMR